MSRNTLLACLAAIAALMVVAPVASANDTTSCPPGVSDASYCAKHNESGLKEEKGKNEATAKGDKVVDVHISCNEHPGCKGKLVLEGPAAKGASAHSAAAGNVVYGTASYSLKFGESANVAVKLTAAGVKAIEQTGKLSATVAAVSGGVRSVVGHLTVKGHKTKHHKKKHHKHGSHATHTKGHPGFTG